MEKAGGRAGHDVAGTIPRQKIREIAELKMKDLHANTIEAAMRTIEGTARSMGIKVE
jgi:large subunit ribosomal protein L11